MGRRRAPLPKGAGGSLAASEVADLASPKGEAKAIKKPKETGKRGRGTSRDPAVSPLHQQTAF